MNLKFFAILILFINASAIAMQPNYDEIALGSNDIHKLCLLEDSRNPILTERALEKISFLVLMRGVDVDTLKITSNNDGTRVSERTPLFFAVLAKKSRTTQLLLQLGADQNKLNLTAEQQNFLADNEHQEVVAILRNTERFTDAEIFAIQEIFADRMLEHKLAKKRSVRTLHEAIQRLYPDLVEKFAQNEQPTVTDFELALLNLTEPRFRTPDNWPRALEKTKRILKCLAQHIPNIHNYRDVNGRSFLYKAVITGIPELVEILLVLGFDRNVQDNARRTARDYAVQFGFAQIARLLEASVHLPENFKDCPVCMTHIGHDDEDKEIGIRCTCKHNFHLECLLPHVERQGNERKTCPVCRRNIVIFDPIEYRENNNIGLIGCNRTLTTQELANIQKLRSLNNVEISPTNRPVRSVPVPQRIDPEFERPEVPELPETARMAAERSLNGLPAQNAAGAANAHPALPGHERNQNAQPHPVIAEFLAHRERNQNAQPHPVIAEFLAHRVRLRLRPVEHAQIPNPVLAPIARPTNPLASAAPFGAQPPLPTYAPLRIARHVPAPMPTQPAAVTIAPPRAPAYIHSPVPAAPARRLQPGPVGNTTYPTVPGNQNVQQ